jgi:hypothetical protein
MNKRELGAKWSKYCNTDKLVDDAVALLREYGHRTTEKGVCAMLDTYFTNKEPLIKMFMTSKNYIGDMRIAVEREFFRAINSPELRTFFSNISAKLYLNEFLRDKNEDGQTIFDCLRTGKSSIDIGELPSDAKQAVKIAAMRKFDYDTFKTNASHNELGEFNQHIDFFRNMTSATLTRNYQWSASKGTPLLRKGTKTSRAFNTVCAYYGIDKLHPEEKVVNGVTKTVYPYNKVFAEYSDLVSDLVRKMQFIISLNPLDYLTMSNGVNWISCHNIRSGGCMGGTMSYMLDNVSIITFVVEKLGEDIHKIPKVYRQMYHYENNLFMQSRLYPQGNDGATNLYDKFRDYVIDEFSEMLGVEGEWRFLVGSNYCTKHAISANGSKHYPDYMYNRSAGIFYPVNNEPRIRNHVMTIGYTPICVNCGKPLSEHGRLAHYDRRDCAE